VRVLDFAMLYVMLALGLNVVVGFAGCSTWLHRVLRGGRLHGRAAGSPHLTSQFEWIAALAPNGCTSVLIIVPIAMALAATFGSCSVRRRCACAATTWPS
jgi:branched-chain amino acid transport system permease protein